MEVREIIANIQYYRHPEIDKILFSNISIKVSNDQIFCLIGLSGAGKSTLLKILLEMAPGQFEGSVHFCSNDHYYKVSEIKLIGKVGLLSPEASLIPWLKIKNNLILPSKLNNNLIIPKESEINNIINSLGMNPNNVLALYPHELSLGMQRRIALARVLLYKPSFLFLDELFNGLDIINVDIIANYIKNYISEEKALCFLITHDVRQAFNLTHDIFYLSSNHELTELSHTDTEENIRQMMKADLEKPTLFKKK